MPLFEYSAVAMRRQVGGDEVILGLSGGVDSSVVAAVLHRAIGTQLTCIFVDNGLLRVNEDLARCERVSCNTLMNGRSVATERFNILHCATASSIDRHYSVYSG